MLAVELPIVELVATHQPVGLGRTADDPLDARKAAGSRGGSHHRIRKIHRDRAADLAVIQYVFGAPSAVDLARQLRTRRHEHESVVAAATG